MLLIWQVSIVLQVAERSPLDDRLGLLTAFDSTNTMAQVLGGKGGYNEAATFAEIAKGAEIERVIARLKASPTWNAIDHKDNHFVEWVDNEDPRLLAALN